MKLTEGNEARGSRDDVLIDAARREILGEGSSGGFKTREQAGGVRPSGADERAPADPDKSLTETVLPDSTHRPKRIAHYHVKRVIASGGMGTVYEATQDHPRRTVAIKVMKHGVTSPRALRRFEYESQILARLHHPCIAHVYEAGWHQDGDEQVPFFAMEYIPNAKSILECAKKKHLSARERLVLFIGVCQAVHHGHQRGIIHRDLKPGNILIDAMGQVKVIDFGVARSTDADMSVTTLQTSVGELVGTLKYMSPEQCQADPNDLDIRSDIYSLGVLLFELLTGKMPYDLYGTPIASAPSVICDEPPTRLGSVDRSLRGDIETIVDKALAKDRQRRYQSALAMAEDIQRYLDNEPILARAPSAVYRLRKLVQRRRKPVAAACVLAVAAFAVGALLARSYVVQMEKTRLENERQIARLEQIRLANEFQVAEAALTLQDLANQPIERRNVLRTCDDAIRKDDTNARAYAVRARVHYLDGDYASATSDCHRALEFDADNVLALRTCAFTAQDSGDFAVARELYERAMAKFSFTVDLPRDFYNRGRMRRIAGDSKGALEDNNRAVALAPQNGLALRGRGVTRYMMGDRSGAIADLEEAARYLDDRVVTLYLWIWEMRMLRNEPGDREAAEHAFTLAENASQTQNLAEKASQKQNLAVGLMAMWRGERSPEEHLASLTKADDRAQVHYYLAVQALVAGHREQAIEHFHRVVDPPVLHRWAEFDLALWHLQRLKEEEHPPRATTSGREDAPDR